MNVNLPSKPHAAKKSQKGRKIGRNGNKPCQKRYILQHRREFNAKRRAARHAKRIAKFAARRARRVARG